MIEVFLFFFVEPQGELVITAEKAIEMVAM